MKNKNNENKLNATGATDGQQNFLGNLPLKEEKANENLRGTGEQEAKDPKT